MQFFIHQEIATLSQVTKSDLELLGEGPNVSSIRSILSERSYFMKRIKIFML